MRYVWPADSIVQLGGAVCTECGALIADTITHDKWHKVTLDALSSIGIMLSDILARTS